jgi:NAD(P)-dependent dehydrogenase (short-subunit alcohol dehydrogenase family)
LKAGVHAFTQHVAGAGGPDGIRCTCVMVGGVDNRFAPARGYRLCIPVPAADEARFITDVRRK